MEGGFWGIMTIVGPIILGIAIIWAIMHNRTSKAQKQRTEDATRRLYDQEARDDGMSDPSRR